MKKITFLFTFLIAFGYSSYAQVNAYAFSQNVGTYNEITGGTVLALATGSSAALSFDSQLWAISDGSIPFNFNFNGVDYTGCSVNSNGHITFGAITSTTTTYTPISSTTGYSGAISAWAGDTNAAFITGVIAGETRWEVVGTAPNREFVIQFKNWRPAYSTSTTNVPYMNFQFRLAETSNVVKIVYGPSGYAAGSTSSSGTRQIGLRGASNADYNNRLNATSLAFTSSTAGTVNSSSQAYNTTVATPGMPSNGLEYTWTPPSPCTGTPVAGTVSPAAQILAPGQTPAALVASGFTSGVSGITFQWQESDDNGVGDAWANAIGGTGATTASYTPPAFSGSQIYYRLVVTCTNSGLFDNTASVVLNPCSAINTFPFLETFETSSTSRACWSNSFVTGTSNWTYATGAGGGTITTAFAGTLNARFVSVLGTATPVTKLVSPVLNLTSLTVPRLIFQYGQEDWTGDQNQLKVYYRISATDPWVEIGYYTTNVASWTEVVLTLPSPSATYQIAFEGINNYGRANVLDNVIVEESPACIQPTTLLASNITASSADLSWVDGSGGLQFDYEYVVQAQGVGMPAGAGTALDISAFPLPVNVGSLSPNTLYEFWVRADCGGSGYSLWSGPHNFRTACNAFTVPFTEGFNSTSTTEACWTVLNVNADADAWDMNYASNPFEGNQSAAIYTDFNAGANDDWLISPQITLTGNQRLKFHYRVQSAGEPNDFELLLSTTGKAPANFTNTLIATTSYSNITYVERIVDISAYTGDVYIAWHIPVGGLDGWRLYIDNVIVEDIPACLPPTALTASNITASSVDLSWSHATVFDFEYAIQATGTGVPTGTGVVASSTSVTGITTDVNSNPLTSATTYEVYVRTDCGGSGYSTWAGPINFTTSCMATNIPYTMNFESATVPALPICTSQQNVGTGNLWTVVNNPGYGFTTKTLRYLYNSTNAANVWFYTQGVNLTGGTTYRITYDYGATGATFPEKLKVSYGTSATAAGMTELIEDHPNVVNATPINYTEDFTPSVTGVYYFGFNAYSIADQFYLFVDNITVDLALSTNSFDSNAFVAYPNPVKDVLNLEYNSEISSVKVINLLGQVVISKTINANATKVDMSQLNAGAYIVNVTIGDAVKTIKVVKQ